MAVTSSGLGRSRLPAWATSFAEAAKATKDQAVGQKLLDKQREVLTAEREYLKAN